MTERVGIERVYIVEGLPIEEQRLLADLTMTIRERDLFNKELFQMGYYITEGQRGAIDESSGEMGTVFDMFRLDGNVRTREKVCKITTFLTKD